jgi:hypothetical protein
VRLREIRATVANEGGTIDDGEHADRSERVGLGSEHGTRADTKRERNEKRGRRDGTRT